MAIKGYSAFPKTPTHWSLIIRLLSAISRTLVGGVLPLCRDAAGVFYSPSRLGHSFKIVHVINAVAIQHSTWPDLTQDLFLMWWATHNCRLMRDRHRICLIPSSLPILGLLRRQVINFVLPIRYLFIRFFTKPDLAWSRFIEGTMHESKLMRNHYKKCIVSSVFTLLRRLRRQAIKSSRLSRYCLVEEHPTKSSRQVAPRKQGEAKLMLSMGFNWLSTKSMYDTRPFYNGGHTQIETCAAVTKMLGPINVTHIGVSYTKPWTQPCRVGSGRGKAPGTRWFSLITPTRR